MSRKIILWVSVAILCIYIGIALAAPLIAPHGPTAITGKPLQPPDNRHMFGTNNVGQDIFAQLVFGSRITLLFGFFSALFCGNYQHEYRHRYRVLWWVSWMRSYAVQSIF